MRVDIGIIGGGIAGLSCAAAIGSDASVAILEAEPTLGYHATGRSAALYTECYGSEVIRRLAKASRSYYTEAHPELSAIRGLIFPAPNRLSNSKFFHSHHAPLRVSAQIIR